MEKRLNAALANALDDDIMSQLKGDNDASEVFSVLMPKEVPPNVPKAGRRKSVLASDAHERGSGALSSRSCGNDGSHATSASENELMSSLIRRLTEAVSRSPSATWSTTHCASRCDRNAS